MFYHSDKLIVLSDRLDYRDKLFVLSDRFDYSDKFVVLVTGLITVIFLITYFYHYRQCSDSLQTACEEFGFYIRPSSYYECTCLQYCSDMLL